MQGFTRRGCGLFARKRRSDGTPLASPTTAHAASRGIRARCKQETVTMTAANHAEHIIPRTTTKIHDLAGLLDRVEQLTYINGEVNLEDIIAVVGTRWFGPLLMMPGLVMVVPGVGDIPGVSVLMGLVVL